MAFTISSSQHLAPVVTLDDDARVYGVDGSLIPRPYRFDPADTAHLSRLTDGRVRVRLVTAPDVVEARTTKRTGDTVTSHAMSLELDGTVLRVWSLALPLADGDQFSLSFVEETGRVVYLTNAGIAGAVERLDRWTVDLSAIEVVDVPEWAVGSFIYQVFPDRFANGDATNDPEGVDPWAAPPRRDGFQGGDLVGVIHHLDHLERLGVDVLYLNPVVVSPSNHRYDAADFHHVDPMLGGDEAFDALREATAARGMRLVVDLSINHCHPSHAAFADVRDRGPDSPHWGWFRVSAWPLEVRYRPGRRPATFEHFGDAEARRFESETGIPFVEVDDPGPFIEATYDSWYGVPSMPRFDLTNPEARSYLLSVAGHWLDRFGADGIRMDVARYIELDVWREVRDHLRTIRPDAYLLCEIFGEARRWLQGDTFDGVMNYVARHLLLEFCRGDLTGPAFLAGVERMLAAVTPEATSVSQSLLGSHDTGRFLTEVGGERRRLEFATALQFTLPGAPGVYYGDEVYLTGGHDPDCRGGFPWGEETSSKLAETISDLSRLRRAHPALRSGDWHPVPLDDDVVGFRRRRDGDEVLVVANRSPRAATVDVGDRPLLWGEAIATVDGVSVAAWSVVVLGGGDR